MPKVAKERKERGTTHALFQYCEKEKNTNKVCGIAMCTSLWFNQIGSDEKH